MAQGLYRSFPNAKDDCPEIIAKNFITILSRYPVEIIRQVCDPLNGIPGEQTFVPSPKELRDACEKRFGPVLRLRESEARAARQVRARKEDEAQRAHAPKTGAVADYLAGRQQDQRGPDAAPETILRVYLEGRERYGKSVSLSPEARAIIEAAGLEIPT